MNDSITNSSTINDEMKPEYDLSTMKRRPNPFAKQLGHQLTLALDAEVIAYFEAAARDRAMSCQELMVLYLRDCVANQRQLSTVTEELADNIL